MTFSCVSGKPRAHSNLIPIDFKVSSQAQLARRAGQEDIIQVDETGLLAPSRKAQVRPGGVPSSVPVRNFQTQRLAPFW